MKIDIYEYFEVRNWLVMMKLWSTCPNFNMGSFGNFCVCIQTQSNLVIIPLLFESKMVAKIKTIIRFGQIWFPSRLCCCELISIIWEPWYDPSDHIITSSPVIKLNLDLRTCSCLDMTAYMFRWIILWRCYRRCRSSSVKETGFRAKTCVCFSFDFINEFLRKIHFRKVHFDIL